MPLSFFNEPKINRIANHLEAQLTEICQQKWAHYLDVIPPGDQKVRYKFHFKNRSADDIVREVPAQVAACGLFRSKDHFSWELGDAPTDYDPKLRFNNAEQQYLFYSGLLQDARQLKEQLSKSEPNYNLIMSLARKIKEAKTTVPSIINGDPIDLNVGWMLGGNLIVDFFAGAIGLVWAPAMALAGILCIPAYMLSYSQYIGSPQFFCDAALYFCTSLCQVISSALFPLGMLYSKYTTDSYDTLFEGDVERSLDGIMAIARTHTKVDAKRVLDQIRVLTSDDIEAYREEGTRLNPMDPAG